MLGIFELLSVPEEVFHPSVNNVLDTDSRLYSKCVLVHGYTNSDSTDHCDR